MEPVGHTLLVRAEKERHVFEVIALEQREGFQLVHVRGCLSLFDYGNYDAIYRTTTHEVDGIVFVSTYKWIDNSTAIYSGSFRSSGEWRLRDDGPKGPVKR
jgi:hypothetical protein